MVRKAGSMGQRSRLVGQAVGMAPEELDVVIKFGGGLHTRASEDEIEDREAADGYNFILDAENKELRPRPPFDLIATVPNAAAVRGGASLIKADGTVSTLFQAGTKVYEWDGQTTFTEEATVSADARLRGHWFRHNWELTNTVIITDLALVETVKSWNGTSWASVAFEDTNGDPFGNFYAMYCNVSDERALYSGCRDATTNKHMMVGSERGDYTVVSVDDRPSSSLSEADPFFLLTPDLRAINGHIEAFGVNLVSTTKGQLFQLTGTSAKDFAFEEFYPGSAASGAESLAYIGNDVIYGRAGRIESVRDTDRFGDAENDDLSMKISNVVSGYTGWRSVYNSRLNRVYIFPDGVSEVWVFQTALIGGEVSPWMRWTTAHSLAFQPTFVMAMLDPIDGLEYVFMGDSLGNIYRLEGTGENGDGGTNAIETQWLTKLLSAPLNAQTFNVEGYIKYRKDEAFSIDLTFEYAGENIFSEALTINVPAVAGRNYFSNGVHYGGGFYYGSIAGKLSRQPFFPPGQANEFQVRVRVQTEKAWAVNEIGLRFNAASS
jgi:hypothetical protein